MTVKSNTHHIVNFPFVPVGGRPRTGNSGRDGIIFIGHQGLEAEMEAARHRIQFVDDFIARIVAKMVDTRDIDEVVETKLVAAKFA
jgi:hypothetical protein